MHKDVALTLAARQVCEEQCVSFSLVFNQATSLVKDGFPFKAALAFALREQGVI